MPGPHGHAGGPAHATPRHRHRCVPPGLRTGVQGGQSGAEAPRQPLGRVSGAAQAACRRAASRWLGRPLCAGRRRAWPRSPLPHRGRRKRPLPALAAQWRHDGQPAGRAARHCPLLRPRPLLPAAQRRARGERQHRAEQVGERGGWGGLDGRDERDTGTHCAAAHRGSRPLCLNGDSSLGPLLPGPAVAHRDVPSWLEPTGDVSPPETCPHRRRVPAGVACAVHWDRTRCSHGSPSAAEPCACLPVVPRGVMLVSSAPRRVPSSPTAVPTAPPVGTYRGVLGQMGRMGPNGEGACGVEWGWEVEPCQDVLGHPSPERTGRGTGTGGRFTLSVAGSPL